MTEKHHQTSPESLQKNMSLAVMIGAFMALIGFMGWDIWTTANDAKPATTDELRAAMEDECAADRIRWLLDRGRAPVTRGDLAETKKACYDEQTLAEQQSLVNAEVDQSP